MEKITSRKNTHILRLRRLGAEAEFRRESGETVLDGEKLLREALSCGVTVTSVLWAGEQRIPLPAACAQYTAPAELVEFASPVKQSPGPVFTAVIPSVPPPPAPERVIVLERVQDPGNVGTILRAADALGADAAVLVGECADLWSPRVVRATMGAAFRFPALETDLAGLSALLAEWKLPLCGAALSPLSEDVRHVPLGRSAVAVGNEGRGLSPELLALCRRLIRIPMSPRSESLNAAMAATVLLWEMARDT